MNAGSGGKTLVIHRVQQTSGEYEHTGVSHTRPPEGLSGGQRLDPTDGGRPPERGS